LPEQKARTVLVEALTEARAIEDEVVRCRALAAVAAHLPAPERDAVLAEALAAAPAIVNEWCSPAKDLNEADVRRRRSEMGDDERSARTLAALAAHLPAPQRRSLLAEGVVAVPAIQHQEARSAVLAALAPHLPAELLAEALAAARTIGDEVHRCGTLAALAAHLPASETLTAARDTVIYSAFSHPDVVLAVLKPEEYRRDWPAIFVLRRPDEEESRTWTLAQGAQQLSGELLAEALAAARGSRNQSLRSKALAALAPRLAEVPGPVLSSLWSETLPLLAVRTRPELLADLRGLTPVLAALAGLNLPTELGEVARAISDVARWWP
jgi:hypothetical protein